MDSKNMIIAVLSVTAVMLLCTLVLVHNDWSGQDSSLAWADTTDLGGDYILATGAVSSTISTNIGAPVYALNGSNDKLNVYHYDPKNKRIVLYDSLNLRDYFDRP